MSRRAVRVPDAALARRGEVARRYSIAVAAVRGVAPTRVTPARIIPIVIVPGAVPTVFITSTTPFDPHLRTGTGVAEETLLAVGVGTVLHAAAAQNDRQTIPVMLMAVWPVIHAACEPLS
jgi:hypothetical protein